MRLNMTNSWIAGALAVALTACGGAQKTESKEMSKLASDAPPPPSVTPNAKVERKVSTEAKSDFADAVKYFQEQEKTGWTSSSCGTAAEKFQSVAGSHEKLVEAYFNAGVSYQKCGDDKQAEG